MRNLLSKLPMFWLGFTLFCLPIITQFRGDGLAIFVFVLGLLGWAEAGARGEIFSILKQRWFAGLCAFLLWVCAAQIWSDYAAPRFLGNAPKISIFTLAAIGALHVARDLNPRRQMTFAHFAAAASCLSIGIICSNVLSGYGLSAMVEAPKTASELLMAQIQAEKTVGRGVLIFDILAPPLAVLLWQSLPRQRWAAAAFLAALAAAAWANQTSLVPLVLAGSLVVMWAAWKCPKTALRAVLILAALSIFLAPVLGVLAAQLGEDYLAALPSSWAHRLRGWAYAWARICEAPLWGQGFDMSRTYSETYTVFEGYDVAIISLHPHNIGLQIWLETGAIGAALGAAFIASLYRPLCAFTAEPARGAGLCGMIFAATLITATTTGAWQHWWWASLVLGGLLLQLLPAPLRLRAQDAQPP